MPITVTVKWGKQKLENIELDTSEPVEVFKAQLYALTSVPPERQKIMGVKGGFVKVRAPISFRLPAGCILARPPAAACCASQASGAAAWLLRTWPTLAALRRRRAPSGTTSA